MSVSDEIRSVLHLAQLSIFGGELFLTPLDRIDMHRNAVERGATFCPTFGADATIVRALGVAKSLWRHLVVSRY